MKRQAFLRRLAGAAALLLMVPVFGLSSGAADGTANEAEEKPSLLSRGAVLTGKGVCGGGKRPADASLQPFGRCASGRGPANRPRLPEQPENVRDDALAKGVTLTNMSSQLLITAADTKGTVESYNSSVDSVGEGGLTVSPDHGRRDSRLFISSKSWESLVPLCCHAK